MNITVQIFPVINRHYFHTVTRGEYVVYAIGNGIITLCSVDIINNTNIHSVTYEQFYKMFGSQIGGE